MTTQEELLRICHTCPYKQRRCTVGQPCLCTADGIDIREHARAGFCPQNMYPPASLPAAQQQQSQQPTSPPPQPQQPHQPSTVSTIAHGAAGIARAVTGTGGADQQLIQKRTSICATCEHNELTMGLIHRCKLCGCLTWAKARNLEEKCPVNKW
jgi:hypothetical protein